MATRYFQLSSIDLDIGAFFLIVLEATNLFGDVLQHVLSTLRRGAYPSGSRSSFERSEVSGQSS